MGITIKFKNSGSVYQDYNNPSQIETPQVKLNSTPYSPTQNLSTPEPVKFNTVTNPGTKLSADGFMMADELIYMY